MEFEFDYLLNKYPAGKRGNLIPILQEIQDKYGFLNEQAVMAVSDHLNIPSVKIFSVATFYNEFRFSPTGKFHIQVCQGTGCLVDGSEPIRNELMKVLGIGPGEITHDGWFSLEWVPCLGVCQESPVISVNGRIIRKVTIKAIRGIIEQYRQNQK